jgi:hypothetical protein
MRITNERYKRGLRFAERTIERLRKNRFGEIDISFLPTFDPLASERERREFVFALYLLSQYQYRTDDQYCVHLSRLQK